MLSILIPVYNYNAVGLVQELSQQATQANIPFEILLLDDNSDENSQRENVVLRDFPNSTLFELPTKAGRSIARNFLASQAKYDYLLFMDCDSEPVDELYIARYLPYCKGKDVVVCGGTSYKNQKPNRDSYLRWVYGTRCEAKTASEREKSPNSRFSTFNFLIAKELFLSIRFNELLRNYGHEDTLFGLELLKNDYSITHIDNPLYHTGIDTNEVYLEKTRQGVENLKILMEQYPDREKLIRDIRLLRYYMYLEKMHITSVFFLKYKLFKNIMLKNFNSRHPNLTLFNLYKLGYLCSLKYKSIVEI